MAKTTLLDDLILGRAENRRLVKRNKRQAEEIDALKRKIVELREQLLHPIKEK